MLCRTGDDFRAPSQTRGGDIAFHILCQHWIDFTGKDMRVRALGGKAQEPYVILQYLQDLATSFHSFYNKHRVVTDDAMLTKSRLILVECVRIVLANGLRLLGVSLPRKM